MPREVAGIQRIAALSEVPTIDIPFILESSGALAVGAGVEGFYKAVRRPKHVTVGGVTIDFREQLKAETEAARYKGIDPMFRALAEREAALENARLHGLYVPDLPGYGMPRGLFSYYHDGIDGGYDDGISSLLLGYTTQATGNPNLEIGKLKDEAGPLLPNGVERGAQLFKAGRDAGTAIHEFLTEQRILNQRRFRGIVD